MNKADILAHLKREQDPRGLAHWNENPQRSGGLKSHGIGLVKLRKFAKSLGRDPKLAKQLWSTNLHEAKVLALLIDDPKTMTVEQAETQVEQLQGGYLEHVFSSCDATLAKAPFANELLETWVLSKDKVRHRCGHGLLYEASKSKKKTAPTEATFLKHITRIGQTYKGKNQSTLLAMGNALMGMGCRTKTLNAAALRVAKQIGPIHFDPTGKCAPFDVEKHLTKDLIQKRLGT